MSNFLNPPIYGGVGDAYGGSQFSGLAVDLNPGPTRPAEPPPPPHAFWLERRGDELWLHPGRVWWRFLWWELQPNVDWDPSDPSSSSSLPMLVSPTVTPLTLAIPEFEGNPLTEPLLVGNEDQFDNKLWLRINEVRGPTDYPNHINFGATVDLVDLVWSENPPGVEDDQIHTDVETILIASVSEEGEVAQELRSDWNHQPVVIIPTPQLV